MRDQGKDSQRLYHDLSWIWPVIAPPEDYVEETEFFINVIKEKARRKVRTLLHLGCGGGRHDYTFKRYFDVTGVDISKDMLCLAKKLNPEVNYAEGDMRHVRWNRTFDAVVVFDSINYMKTEHNLRQVFQTAHEHLNPGGIFLTFMEERREMFTQNRTISSTHSLGDLSVTFIENSFDPDPTDSHFEMTLIFLVRRKNKLDVYKDTHIWGLFATDTWRRLLGKTGYDVHQLPFKHTTFLEQEYLPMFACLKPKENKQKR